MASRYFCTKSFPDYLVSFPVRGAWDETLSGPRVYSPIEWCYELNQSAARGGIAALTQFTENDARANLDVMLYRGVTPRLAAQTISGTVDLCIGTRQTSDIGSSTVVFHVHIFVTVGDTTAVRGVLLNDYIDSVNFTGTATFRALAAAQTLSSVVLSDGDRVVVEIGFRIEPNNVDDTTVRQYFGSGSAPNGAALPAGAVGGTDVTTKAGYVDFSHTFVEQAAPAAPANDACVDAAVITLPHTETVNVSQSTDTDYAVWYQFTATEDGTAILTSLRSNYPTIFDVYTGSCGALGSPISTPGASTEGSMWVSRSQAIVRFAVTNGTTYRVRVTAASSTRPGVLAFSLTMQQAHLDGDLYLSAQHILVVRNGMIVNFQSAFYGQTPTGTVIDNTLRPIPNINGGTHSLPRLAVLLFDSELIELLDLATLNVGENEVAFIDMRFDPPSLPVPADAHGSSLSIDSSGDFIVGFFGDAYSYLGVPGSPASSYARRVTGDVVFGSSPDQAFIEAEYQIAQGNGGSDYVSLTANEQAFYYTSADQVIRAFDMAGNAQLPDVATVPSAGGPRPGLRGLRIFTDGSLFVTNGSNVVQVNPTTGAVIRTFTATSPTYGPATDLDKIGFSPSYSQFYVTDQLTGTLYTFDVSTGLQVSADDFGLPAGQLCGFSVQGTAPVLVVVEDPPKDDPKPPDDPPDCDCPTDGGTPDDPPTDKPIPRGYVPFCGPSTGIVGDYPPIAQPSMKNNREPRTWMTTEFKNIHVVAGVTQLDPNPVSWALDASIPDPPSRYNGRKPASIKSISEIAQMMSDEDGNYAGSSVTVELNDKDRKALRERMNLAPHQYVWDREATIYVTSETARRANATARELFRGISNEVGYAPGFNGSMKFEDRLTATFGVWGPSVKFSRRLFPKGMLPGLPQQLSEKPVQIILGEVSDHGSTLASGTVSGAKGMVPLWLMGRRFWNGEWYDEYHLAGHAVKAFALYGTNNAATGAKRVLLDLNALGAAGDVLAPGYPGWPIPQLYLDVLNPVAAGGDGKYHRVTHIFIRENHFLSESHKRGAVTLAANVCGVEDIGDGTGNLITDLYSQYQWLFEHVLLPDEEWTTGNYPGASLWPSDGRSMVDSISFSNAQQLSARHVGGRGYEGGWMVCGPGEGAIGAREIMRRMTVSGNCWFGWSGNGQLRCITFDTATNVSATPILWEPTHIREWPSAQFGFEEVENPVLFQYDYDDDLRTFRSDVNRAEDGLAWIRMGNRPRPSREPVQMRCIRNPVTARDVAQRRLFRRKFPPVYVPVAMPIDGLDHNVGDIVRITSQEGPGPKLDKAPILIHAQKYDPKTKRTNLIGRALQMGGVDLLVAPSTLQATADPNVATLQNSGDPNVMRLM